MMPALPPSHERMSSPGGARQLGRYRLLRHLATGGMAEIWLASIDNARRPDSGPFRFSCPDHAVIKVIAPERVNDRTFVQMFLDEARVAATLYHPNIAQLYEVGRDADTYFHAIEYIHGENVRAAIERSLIVRKPTPIAATVAIGRAVAAALHYAHDRNGATGEPLEIVHRDVTPSNIMIGWDGVVKLVDFGVALAAGRAAQTRTGVVKGKLAYMSPEQCRGLKVDRRADVFALGVVLYEVSLQRRAFRGDTEYQTMERIVGGHITPPTKVRPDYPPALERIVMRALAPDLALRYQSAAELGAALAEFQAANQLADGPVAMAEYMRTLFGAPPAPGDDVAPVSLDLRSVRSPSPPPGEDGSGGTREAPTFPAAGAAAAPAATAAVYVAATVAVAEPAAVAVAAPAAATRSRTGVVIGAILAVSAAMAAVVVMAGGSSPPSLAAAAPPPQPEALMPARPPPRPEVVASPPSVTELPTAAAATEAAVDGRPKSARRAGRARRVGPGTVDLSAGRY